jgi:hypothetical protein
MAGLWWAGGLAFTDGQVQFGAGSGDAYGSLFEQQAGAAVVVGVPTGDPAGSADGELLGGGFNVAAVDGG